MKNPVVLILSLFALNFVPCWLLFATGGVDWYAALAVFAILPISAGILTGSICFFFWAFPDKPE